MDVWRKSNPRPSFDGAFQNLSRQIRSALDETTSLREKLQAHDTRINSLETHLTGSYASSHQSPLPEQVAARLKSLEDTTASHEVLLVENNRMATEKNTGAEIAKRDRESMRDSVRKIERRMDSLEHALALRNVMLEDIKEQQTRVTYDCTSMWKITDFSRKRRDAISGRQASFLSPYFYTSQYGYKMCARIYLNGDGLGRETHISLFLCIMRGEYDALLSWPFRKKVTFVLLDQDNVENVSDAFMPDPRSSSFQRPSRDMNIASGCPCFCSFGQLKKRSYVVDDTMFIKILVDDSHP